MHHCEVFHFWMVNDQTLHNNQYNVGFRWVFCLLCLHYKSSLHIRSVSVCSSNYFATFDGILKTKRTFGVNSTMLSGKWLTKQSPNKYIHKTLTLIIPNKRQYMYTPFWNMCIYKRWTKNKVIHRHAAFVVKCFNYLIVITIIKTTKHVYNKMNKWTNLCFCFYSFVFV